VIRRVAFEVETTTTEGRALALAAGLGNQHDRPVGFYLTSIDAADAELHTTPEGEDLRHVTAPTFLGDAAPGRGAFASWTEERRAAFQTGQGFYARGQREPSGESWVNGVKGWAALRTRLGDWPEGAAALAEVRDAVRTGVVRPKSIRRRRHWREEGAGVPDVSRFALRDWDRMYRVSERRRGAGTGVVEIGVEFGGSAAWTTRDTLYGAATAAAACEILEAAGYRVGLSGWHFARSNAGAHAVVMGSRIRFKDPGGRMQADRVTAISGDMAVFRSIGFMLEKATGWPGQTHGGYTSPSAPMHEALRAANVPVFQRPDVWFQRVRSLDAAKRHLSDLITAVNDHGSNFAKLSGLNQTALSFGN